MNREDQVKREATTIWMEIDRLILKTKAEQEAADRELDDLNRRLPHMLLGMAKGLVSREEVRALKARIAELQEIICDVPIIIRELEREKRQRCYEPLQDACFIAKRRKEYNVLKEQMSQSCSIDHVEALRKYAEVIDEEEDCERFLTNVITHPSSKH
jgi:hypothetical protein